MKRLMKKGVVVVSYICWDDLEGPLENIIDRLGLLLDTATNDGFTNVVLASDGAYNCRPDYHLLGDRPETDKEMASRKKALAKAASRRAKEKKAREERELKEYNRLKKKFE